MPAPTPFVPRYWHSRHILWRPSPQTQTELSNLPTYPSVALSKPNLEEPAGILYIKIKTCSGEINKLYWKKHNFFQLALSWWHFSALLFVCPHKWWPITFQVWDPERTEAKIFHFFWFVVMLLVVFLSQLHTSTLFVLNKRPLEHLPVLTFS